MTVFERSTIVGAPVDVVFRFHLDTRNAALIAPRGLVIEIVDGAFPLVQGAEVVLRVRQRPLPAQLWRIRVREVVEPVLVVDELLAGPFPRFLHEHRFEALPDGRTRLTDRIDFRLPLGPLGGVLAPLALPALHVVFALRQRATARVLAAQA